MVGELTVAHHEAEQLMESFIIQASNIICIYESTL